MTNKETRTIYVKRNAYYSTAPRERVMEITLPRMPWEPKEEVKEEA
jgi:hypothetical protein